jgi:triacylglycerol lipase
VTRQEASFDLTLASKLARASACAYADSLDGILAELHADRVEAFAEGSASGYIAQLESDCILVFRGTVSAGIQWESAIQQWLTNLDFHQVAVSGGRVHRGFHRALDAVWQQITLQLQNLESTRGRLWITGHSLGGALAILAGSRLHDEGVAVAGVYAFGAPAVGDADFAGRYKPAVHRIENVCDLVCHLPPTGIMVELASKLLGPFVIPRDTVYDSVGTLTIVHDDGAFHTVASPSENTSLSRIRLFNMILAAGADMADLLVEHKIDTYVSRLIQGRPVRQSWFAHVPRRLIKVVGKLKRYASTLRDGSGRIVAFLQETGSLQKAISDRSTRGILLDADGIARTTQLDLSPLTGLTVLGGATLAATAIGIGVSVAGFALVLRNLRRVELVASETRRDAVAARLAAERVDVRSVLGNKARTMACLEQAEEAWQYSDPVPIWEQLRWPLLEQLNHEQCLVGKGETRSIFLDSRFSFEEAVAAYESVLLLDAARTQILLLTSQEKAALFHAQNMLTWHLQSVFPLGPDEIAGATSTYRATQEQREERDMRHELLRRAVGFKERVIEIQRHMESRIDLIRYLLDKGISGRSYIQESRHDAGAPVMLFPVD